jgi:hypothetical protein
VALAQQKIDQIETTPWEVLQPTPAVLVPNSPPLPATTSNPVTESLPLDTDSLNTGTLGSAYTSLTGPITATRSTIIRGVAGSTNPVLAIVTVSFTYRSHTYSITLTTLRAIDSI